jgi:hypothetical protein
MNRVKCDFVSLSGSSYCASSRLLRSSNTYPPRLSSRYPPRAPASSPAGRDGENGPRWQARAYPETDSPRACLHSTRLRCRSCRWCLRSNWP